MFGFGPDSTDDLTVTAWFEITTVKRYKIMNILIYRAISLVGKEKVTWRRWDAIYTLSYEQIQDVAGIERALHWVWPIGAWLRGESNCTVLTAWPDDNWRTTSFSSPLSCAWQAGFGHAQNTNSPTWLSRRFWHLPRPRSVSNCPDCLADEPSDNTVDFL